MPRPAPPGLTRLRRDYLNMERLNAPVLSFFVRIKIQIKFVASNAAASVFYFNWPLRIPRHDHLAPKSKFAVSCCELIAAFDLVSRRGCPVSGPLAAAAGTCAVSGSSHFNSAGRLWFNPPGWHRSSDWRHERIIAAPGISHTLMAGS